MVLRFLTRRFATRQPRTKPSAVGTKLLWDYSVKQYKMDTALIRLSTQIRCFRHCAIPLSSNKSVPQQWLAKRSSWRTVTNTASECISDRQQFDPQHPHPEASQSRVRCNSA